MTDNPTQDRTAPGATTFKVVTKREALGLGLLPPGALAPSAKPGRTSGTLATDQARHTALVADYLWVNGKSGPNLVIVDKEPHTTLDPCIDEMYRLFDACTLACSTKEPATFDKQLIGGAFMSPTKVMRMTSVQALANRLEDGLEWYGPTDAIMPLAADEERGPMFWLLTSGRAKPAEDHYRTLLDYLRPYRSFHSHHDDEDGDGVWMLVYQLANVEIDMVFGPELRQEPRYVEWENAIQSRALALLRQSGLNPKLSKQ